MGTAIQRAVVGDYAHTLHEVKLLHDPDLPQTRWNRLLDWCVDKVEAIKAK
jgi:hypothetical protein